MLAAVRAEALDEEVDFLADEAGRQRDLARQGDVVEAADVVAAQALEVRVFVLVLAGTGAEAPDLVAAGDAVHQLLIDQPFKHAVQRDRVERRLRQAFEDLAVRQRFFLRQQKRQHAHARLGDAGAGVADQDFGFFGCGCGHGTVILDRAVCYHDWPRVQAWVLMMLPLVGSALSAASLTSCCWIWLALLSSLSSLSSV